MKKSDVRQLTRRTDPLAWLITILTFGGYGVLLGLILPAIQPWRNLPAALAVYILALYLGILLCTVAHELGHLAFGLATGYRFVSFRAFSLIWERRDGRIHFEHKPLPGMAGQCLMAPPPDGAPMPVTLYNLGGVIVNAVLAVAFGALAAALRGLPMLFAAGMATLNLYFALVNGVPLRVSGMDNDGANLRAIRRNPTALLAFWTELSLSEQLARGRRIKDLPEAWFVMPAIEEMSDGMSAELGAWACARLMDEGRYEEANAAMIRLLDSNVPINWINRCGLVCNRIFCELLAGNAGEAERLASTIQNFLRAMRRQPHVLRTQYALAKLAARSDKEARRARQAFERCAKACPQAEAIEAEWERMRLIDARAETLNE